MMLIYSPEALGDIDEIHRHVSAQSIQMADTIEAAIRGGCEACERSPYLYPATATKSVRRHPIRRYGFTIFYRVDEKRDAVDILRVVRGVRVTNLGSVPKD
jgi:plasmid stabilization system protein ParE